MTMRFLDRQIRNIDGMVRSWAMHGVLIRVTAADLVRGHRCSCCNCPVARAIQRRCPWTNVFVDGDRVHYEGLSGVPDVQLPAEVARFVRDFDNWVGTPAPFRFVTRVPWPGRFGG